MAKVKDNVHVQDNIYLLSVEYTGICKMGQFFMLRCWDIDPLLSRPISVYDYNEGELHFLYQVIGKGTEKLSKLRKDDEITLQGPYGNGFPYVAHMNITLIGGGMGIAPLFYTARELKKMNEDREINIYLGFRKASPLIEKFQKEFPKVIVNIGGIITDEVIYKKDEIIYTCGPEAMMEKVCKEGVRQGVIVYASVEKNMACGVGACLGCTCKTTKGNKRTCKDGPVFLGDEIIYG